MKKKKKKKKDNWINSPSHFSLFNCCLLVVLQLDYGDYPKNLRVVICPNKEGCFEPFMCFDLISYCLV